MTKTFLGAAAVALGLAAIPASAMPLAPLSGGVSSIELTAGGCGVGFHRGPNGVCRRNGYGAPVVVAPVVVAPVYRRSYVHPYVRHCFYSAGVRVCR
jgi:hypothetical protein